MEIPLSLVYKNIGWYMSICTVLCRNAPKDLLDIIFFRDISILQKRLSPWLIN